MATHDHHMISIDQIIKNKIYDIMRNTEGMSINDIWTTGEFTWRFDNIEAFEEWLIAHSE